MYTIQSGDFLESGVPLKTVSFGAGKQYFIFQHGKPYLNVEVPACSWNPFDTACIFYKKLCIGSGDQVFFVDLETYERKNFSVDLYFGYFYIEKNRIYVASGTQIACFDEQCRLIWESEHLAVDGVVIEGVREGLLLVSCEMDPPGGWVTREIYLSDGNTALIRPESRES